MAPVPSTSRNAYLEFNREQWSVLRDAVPLPLSQGELERLRGINEDISLSEVEAVYLPLSRLLNLYVHANQRRSQVVEEFLGERPEDGPYIISVAGSVAVGKSTTARLLQALLQRWPEHPKVELITTDGFLYPLKELKEKQLLSKKGFPQSYDGKMLLDFLKDVKSGKSEVHAPIYSHLEYDRLTDRHHAIRKPDILILEGLNVLQTAHDYPEAGNRLFVSDFVDFSIYVDAKYDLLKRWYIDRFDKFRQGAFTDPNSYFHHYSKLTEGEARKTASKIWDEINGPNLKANIQPTRSRANLILSKGDDHKVNRVWLRR
ncbi:type I pantothenate kinase [Ferrimonas sediminicola]|uniref:Pantothenate kinase n=1 Tax=Ferrimonas sediminicola TaxID=2569538 RepID=A0A4U1B8Z8_9GAMM|nr:type I pantothenate kinase [Ferrimonas sediminicola]TKB46519.1 type I pantothenate kinase [Ferrimonas sediminicola]